MTINNYFNPTRFFLTLKNDIVRNLKTYLLALGAITGVFTAIDFLPGIIAGNPVIAVQAYLPLFMVLGFIFSSLVFNEMHEPQKGLVYLTTPSSTLEKLISRLLISSVFYVGIMFVYFHVLTLFLNGMNYLFFDASPVDFYFNWTLARIYIIVQSIFIFASSYFKKNAFLKLLFAGFVLQMILSFFSIINMKLLFDLQDMSNIDVEQLDISFGTIADLVKAAFYTTKFLFFWVMAPFFWFMTYLRISEKEV